MKTHKAIFLDKDGTLIPNIPYNVDPEKISLSAGAAEGLRTLEREGFIFTIVSNQSGIARGFFNISAIGAMKKKIESLLAVQKINLAGFYCCPHHPKGTVGGYNIECNCRKPKAGLFEQAASELHIDLSASWMIGDILDDVEAGNRAGCKTILLNNGNETEWKRGTLRTPYYIAKDLKQAATFIQNFNLSYYENDLSVNH